MKKVHGLVIVAVLAACSGVWGIGAAAEAGPESTAKGNTAFALDLYGQLRGTDGNLFFSPMSIRTALGMTYAGARNETARQMAKVLHLPEEQVRAHGELGELVHLLNDMGKTEGCKLTIANALWGQQGYKFLDEFLVVVERNYGAGFAQLDFIRQTEAARKTINDWVAKKTQDKIENLIAPGDLTRLTRLVLTNAIYFKGDWVSPFKERQTKDADFFVGPDKKTTVPTMRQTDEFGYAQTEDLQALELPYARDGVSMVILLPRKRDGLGDVEKHLTLRNLSGWLGALRTRRVAVYLPRFKTEAKFELSTTLASMGMTAAFNMRRADFSGMTGKPNLFISKVIHQAYVDVNEKGTEAAAATAVVMEGKAKPSRPPVFRADHPFLFLIRDRKTGSILFLGRLADPKED